ASNSGPIEFGEVPSGTIRQQTKDLLKVAADSGKYNLKSLAYRLTKFLARPKVASAVVNVDDILEGAFVAPYVMDRNSLVNGLIGVASHEVGHIFGLQHTSLLVPSAVNNEIQKLQIVSKGSPGDTFTLSFAGEKGVHLLNAN